ncbi:hypothetical protein BSPWISOXPB_7947 [uncultured Gammaproteobacteria bacterium]|nr:hypothetical protein BSPWISOXPB_7947 [uncultured Gammaproteobacteria bacterium]
MTIVSGLRIIDSNAQTGITWWNWTNIHYQNINGVHYLLTKLGLSWISARSKHPKQDKEAQALYKKLQTKGNRCLTYGHRLK